MKNSRENMQLIDTELAGCRVVEKIGRGGMAVVYRAYQPRLERWVAIKVLRSDLLSVKEVLSRFRLEARAVAALRHPNILTVYDYGEERGLAYLVMEYVSGGHTLKDRLTKEPWKWPEAVSLLIPVGQALAFAHANGIVHRDVKPGNILLPRDDWPLLSDFGLVKLLEEQQDLTEPGTGVGTPLYAAPEQLVGAKVDHRVDIYALGTILYEMVTGRLPHESDTPAQLMVDRISRPPRPPRQINRAVPPKLEKALMQALAQKPADRYSRMEELVTVLDELWRASLEETERVGHPATQVIQPGEVTLGPHLSIAGTGVLLALSPERETLIGRGTPQSDQIPDIDLSAYGGGQSGVSRLHARLVHEGGQWYLEDLNSTNGTCVNGQPVLPGQLTVLEEDDVIQLGRMSVTFHNA